MKALVTGASSGIGLYITKSLLDLGYEIFAVARDKEKLEKIYKTKKKVHTIALDLSNPESCYKLYDKLKDVDIDILINNAGFGDAGKFVETSLKKELDMINLNIISYHILTKLFLKDFVKRNRGRILNVASMAGFMPGPYMATYYATKSYIVNLTLAIQEELKKENSKVHLSIFCPGPVNTNFNQVANVKFNIPSLSAEEAAKVAVEGMFQNKKIIIPLNMKLNYALVKVSPMNLVLSINSNMQERVEK